MEYAQKAVSRLFLDLTCTTMLDIIYLWIRADEVN